LQRGLVIHVTRFVFMNERFALSRQGQLNNSVVFTFPVNNVHCNLSLQSSGSCTFYSHFKENMLLL